MSHLDEQRGVTDPGHRRDTVFRVFSQEGPIVVDPNRRARPLSESPSKTTEEKREANSETAVRRITARVREAPIGVARCRTENSGLESFHIGRRNQRPEDRDQHDG